jgi:NADPH:quinone reductase-like Zn-dependent oxidoreductase
VIRPGLYCLARIQNDRGDWQAQATLNRSPALPVNRLLLGNTAVVGVASREFFDRQPDTVAALWARLLELRRTGALPDPPVQPFPFADARRALEAIAGRQARGKVVLTKRIKVPEHAEQRPR